MEGRDRGGHRSEFHQCTGGFDVDEITQIAWFRFMEVIVSNGHDAAYLLNSPLQRSNDY